MPGNVLGERETATSRWGPVGMPPGLGIAARGKASSRGRL